MQSLVKSNKPGLLIVDSYQRVSNKGYEADTAHFIWSSPPPCELTDQLAGRVYGSQQHLRA